MSELKKDTAAENTAEVKNENADAKSTNPKKVKKHSF